MPSPADQTPIESQLAELRPPHTSTLPPSEAFIAGVRANRTRTITTRSAFGVVALGIVLLVTLQIARSGGATGSGADRLRPDPSPLARGTGAPGSVPPDPELDPHSDPTTLASFRTLYARGVSVDHLFDDLPTSPSPTGESLSFRLGDRMPRWAEGL